MSDLQTQRQEIYDFVKNMLGGGMVEVELDPSHYETALTRTLADIVKDPTTQWKKVMLLSIL